MTPTPFVGQKTDGVKTVCFLLYIQIVAFASVSPPTVRSFYFFLPLSDGSVRDPKYSPSARDICSFVFSAVRAFEKSNLPVFEKKSKKIPERRDRPFFAPREISEPNRDAVDTDADLQFSFRIKSKETLYSRFFLIIDAIINAHPITANITLKVISILSIY